MTAKKLEPTILAQSISWESLQNSRGKTIADVEYGYEEPHKDLHRAERIIIHFTDGTSLDISINSNVRNLVDQFQGFKPQDMHADLFVKLKTD